MRIGFREAVRLARVEPPVIFQLILDGKLSRGPDQYITIDFFELQKCFPHIKLDDLHASAADDPFVSAERKWNREQDEFSQAQEACNAKIYELAELLKKFSASLKERGISWHFENNPSAEDFRSGLEAVSPLTIVVVFPAGSWPDKFSIVFDSSTNSFGRWGQRASDVVDGIARVRVQLNDQIVTAREEKERKAKEAAAEVARQTRIEAERQRIFEEQKETRRRNRTIYWSLYALSLLGCTLSGVQIDSGQPPPTGFRAFLFLVSIITYSVLFWYGIWWLIWGRKKSSVA